MNFDTLLIATKNRKKIGEFRALLDNSSISLLDLTDLHDVEEVDETGETFEANAKLKASAYARATNVWSLADDSGLEVDALAGKPGVHSARWASMHDRGSGDSANNALLLEQLTDVNDDARTARFVCVLELADPTGQIILTARDHVEGRILRAPQGTNGFGYDPLFFIPSFGRSMAQLSAQEKHAISHRGKAMKKMIALMRDEQFIK
ncbi:MAG TPA: RdgB/HAM1 family non-canonical purine NTP pyrophosphatase [Tepidisphaeraceae bacterium]|nr:RdgB/HAM1 family non-canonical purine NTP pyrophosphatase [Tepidisphaeraceae bacterium]